MQRRLYIDKAHTALDIFRFMVFLSGVNSLFFFFNLKFFSSSSYFWSLGVVVVVDKFFWFDLKGGQKKNL